MKKFYLRSLIAFLLVFSQIGPIGAGERGASKDLCDTAPWRSKDCPTSSAPSSNGATSPGNHAGQDAKDLRQDIREAGKKLYR